LKDKEIVGDEPTTGHHECRTFYQPSTKAPCGTNEDDPTGAEGCTCGGDTCTAAEYCYDAKCNAAAEETGITTCQEMSNYFGTEKGVTWGCATRKWKRWWRNKKCKTAPDTETHPGCESIDITDCQKMSNYYGTHKGVTWGCAPRHWKKWWKRNSCTTQPTVSEYDGCDKPDLTTCQGISDHYGTTKGVTWGCADSDARTTWKSNSCTTKPETDIHPGCETAPVEGCQDVSDKFGTDHGVTWGCASRYWRRFWSRNSCETSPTTSEPYECPPEDEIADCQSISDHYGTDHDVTWGCAERPQRKFWRANSCTTSPATEDHPGCDAVPIANCQQMSNHYGTDHRKTWGCAPRRWKRWWRRKKCKTSPTVTEFPECPKEPLFNCQTISDRYGTDHKVTWGCAPKYAQTWWRKNNCRTSPTQKSNCPASAEEVSVGISPGEYDFISTLQNAMILFGCSMFMVFLGYKTENYCHKMNKDINTSEASVQLMEI